MVINGNQWPRRMGSFESTFDEGADSKRDLSVPCETGLRSGGTGRSKRGASRRHHGQAKEWATSCPPCDGMKVREPYSSSGVARLDNLLSRW